MNIAELTDPTWWLLAMSMLLAAALYGSVGHGGASAYLAVMGLIGMASAEMKPIALSLNIAVSALALVSFTRAGHFSGKLFWPMVSLSVPAAFFGGWLQPPEPVFQLILAAALLVGAWRLVCGKPVDDSGIIAPDLHAMLLLGVVLGFLSGIIGIGGGIFLTPLLIFFRWASAKRAAAVSAAFICANSLAGICGFLAKGGCVPSLAWFLLPPVLVGGWLGSRWGSSHAAFPTLQRALAAVLVIAAAKFVII